MIEEIHEEFKSMHKRFTMILILVNAVSLFLSWMMDQYMFFAGGAVVTFFVYLLTYPIIENTKKYLKSKMETL